MDTEDEIEVVLDPAPEPEVEIVLDEGAKTPIADPPPKAIEPDEGIETLKANLERERSGRLAAEHRESQAKDDARQARGDVHDTNLVLAANAVNTVKQANEILKANYREAMTNGDFEAAADVQMEMASNAAKLHSLESWKEQLETKAKNPDPEVQRQSGDPVEAFAAQLSAKSADWVRSHPEYVTDQRLNQRMLAAHSLAMSEPGMQADTPEYFEAIEGTLKIRQMAREEQSAAPIERRASPPSAPVSRTPPNTNGTKPNTVRLTAAEREMAAMTGLTDAEYAREKLKLQKEGTLN